MWNSLPFPKLFPYLLIAGTLASGVYVNAVIHEMRDVATPERFQDRCGKAPSTSITGDIVVLDYGDVLVTFKGHDSAVFTNRVGFRLMFSQGMTLIGCRDVPSL